MAGKSHIAQIVTIFAYVCKNSEGIVFIHPLYSFYSPINQATDPENFPKASAASG